MATFIEEVALRLYEKYGDDLSSKTLVLPSKRARLFFAEALTNIVSHPIWEPNYISIDELMVQLSGMHKADRLRLVAELHGVYVKHHAETFDEFYHWGEMLVADFDMIDKYMVDASQLFSNISDLKELESDLSYLSEEQIAIINRFWHTLTGDGKGLVEDSKAKTRFLTIWQSLASIYDEYRTRLRELGIGYTGMIYREAIDRLERGEAALPADDKYVFIGFNALSKCEKSLLKHLNNGGQAEFYWDYDCYYTDNKFQEAGMFIRENLELFPCEEGISHDNFKNIESINVISTSSNVAQCQCVVDVLESLAAKNGEGLGKETAIVLTDENLLMPLLYAIPEKFKVDSSKSKATAEEKSAINVTMGHPLRNTLVYSFIERLFELQKHAREEKTGEYSFYYVDVDGLLAHPYISDIDSELYAKLRAQIVSQRLFQVEQSRLASTPVLQTIFRKVDGWHNMSKYLLEVLDVVAGESFVAEDGAFRSEFLVLAAEALVKLENIVEQCGIEVSDSIYRSLVRRYLQSEKISFTGEPLSGLQIMGILETRNLDFKNVIILSMTDNNFPGSRATDKSFLPYSLRFGFDIPTAEHHEGVYAYYFYRLIERAQNVYMVYSSASDGKSTGEPSRYIRQIEYETDFKINFSNVGVKVALSDSNTIKVEKSDEIYAKLLRYTRDKEISPTAFSMYVKCPLSFYLKYIEELYVENELEEDVDSLVFGNIFHKAADLLYSQIKGDADPAHLLEQLRGRGEVERCVDRAIAEVYFADKSNKEHALGGELSVVRSMVLSFLKEYLFNYDIKNRDFAVYDTEYDLKMTVPIEVNGEKLDVNLKGRADRIDSLNNGMMRIIDYKTGAQELNYEDVSTLLYDETENHKKSNIINTLLYSMMLKSMLNRDVRPELYYIAYMADKEFSPLFVGGSSDRLESYSAIAEEFETEVKNLLRDLFDRSKPFVQRQESKGCVYCDFLDVCNKKVVKW